MTEALLEAPALRRRGAAVSITGLRLWNLPLTSHEVYYMAAGKTCATVETVVLAVDTDAGITGWGEVCPIPHYLPAYAGGVAPALQDMAAVLIGADPVGVEAALARADAWLPGHPYAKSALDIALWDITGKVADLPLHALLGGRRVRDLPLYHSITCVGPDDMARIAREAQAQGVAQFQAKLGATGDWSTDVERLAAVREAVGHEPLVYGDWNCGASSLDAIRVGRGAADLDVMLEAPCATLQDCARVQRATGLPMKMDELVHDTDTLLTAHALGIMDVVALKLSKFGGLSALRRARDLCLHLGAKMCVEDTWGSDIATAAALHLAAATDPARVLNVCDLSGYVSPRLAAGAPTRTAGRIAPPDGPGLGIVVDPEGFGPPHLILD
ncbi:MAG: enolase C-terminal domain-like protein [Pseudomonadota bacterium]